MLEFLKARLIDSDLWLQRFPVHDPILRSNAYSNCSLLHLAVTRGTSNFLDKITSPAIVPQLLESCEDGATPLHFAAAFGNLEATEWLICNGANIDAALESNGGTALHVAIRWGNLNLIRILGEAGAKFLPNKRDQRPEALVSWSRLSELSDILQSLKIPREAIQGPLQTSEAFFNRIMTGDLNTCQQILLRNLSLLSKPSTLCSRCAPIIAALCWDKDNIFEFLIDRNASTAGETCGLYPHHGSKGLNTVILALERPRLNNQLRKLLDLSLKHHNHWMLQDCGVVHTAAAMNPEALDILWEHVIANPVFFS